MTHSQQVLISLLKKSLFNFEAQLPNDVDWQEVFEEAKFQSVIPMAYDATSGIEGIPTEVLKQFKSNTIAIMFNNDKVVKAQSEICKLLEGNKIDYCILKGLSVARYYNKPELRTLGDVDILVSKDEFGYVKGFLSQNGYELIDDEKNHFHCAFKKDEVIIELHFEMSDFPNTPVCDELRKKLDKALENIEKAECMGTEFYSLNDLYQACSLLLHTERHITKDGIGLRQLLDFGFFVKENPNVMSDEKIVGFLKEFGLFKLATICFDLFKKYFCNETVENISADKLFELSLVKGNFGSKQDNNQLLSNRVLGSREGANKIFFVRWFRYFKYRSTITWELAKKHTWLSNLAFIYLPVRYLVRLVLGKKEKIDMSNVLDSSKTENELYSSFKMFEKE